jgi:hypothetical protein
MQAKLLRLMTTEWDKRMIPLVPLSKPGCHGMFGLNRESPVCPSTSATVHLSAGKSFCHVPGVSGLSKASAACSRFRLWRQMTGGIMAERFAGRKMRSARTVPRRGDSMPPPGFERGSLESSFFCPHSFVSFRALTCALQSARQNRRRFHGTCPGRPCRYLAPVSSPNTACSNTRT